MLAFAAAVFFLTITPGPGVLTTAGVGSGYGYRAGLIFLAGLFIGTNLVSLAVATGLAAIVFSVPVVRTVLVFCSAAYLLYLAAKIAFSGSKIAFIHAERAPGFLNGVLLQTINPKAYAVSTTFFSGFAFMPDNLLAEVVIKFAIMNALWVPVHFVWLGAGVMVRRMQLGERVQFAVNCVMAVSMLAVVGLTAFSVQQG